jgi:uncharacterized protein (TIGR03435 family)
MTLAIVLTHSTVASTQSPSQRAQPTIPEFEVASVRLSGPNQRERNGLYIYPGGEVRCNGCRLEYLIMRAFDVQQFQISGGPAWKDLVSGDSFDIEAKPPKSSSSARSNPASPKSAPSEEQRQMLLALLVDRFQLKFHDDTREGPVYLLERGNGELKLQTPKDPNAIPWLGGIEGGMIYRPTGVAGMNASMQLVAQRLSRYLERPVIDKTGISGSFDFKFENEESDPHGEITRDDVVSSILTSVHGIGLKLTPAKGSVETIVIDHVEKPSSN